MWVSIYLQKPRCVFSFYIFFSYKKSTFLFFFSLYDILIFYRVLANCFALFCFVLCCFFSSTSGLSTKVTNLGWVSISRFCFFLSCVWCERTTWPWRRNLETAPRSFCFFVCPFSIAFKWIVKNAFFLASLFCFLLSTRVYSSGSTRVS